MAGKRINDISYELLGRVIDGCALRHECNHVLTQMVHSPKLAECMAVALKAKVLTDHFYNQYETIETYIR